MITYRGNLQYVGRGCELPLFIYAPIKGYFLVVLYAEYREVGDRLVATTACHRCGTIVGDLSVDEVMALSTGKYGPVLCFECEDKSCHRCHKELTPREVEMNSIDEEGFLICWFCDVLV